MRPLHEPLEANGNFGQPAAEIFGHAIDHRAADEGLANGRAFAPVTLGEQIADRDAQVVIRIEKPPTARDDTVSIEIRIVSKRDIVLVSEIYQTGHRIR